MQSNRKGQKEHCKIKGKRNKRDGLSRLKLLIMIIESHNHNLYALTNDYEYEE